MKSRLSANFPWLAAAVVAVVAWNGVGCASKPPPPPPPKAWEEANRLAAQATRLQAAGDWTAALAWWDRAARQFRLLNDRTNLAMAWHNEAVAHRALGRPAEALRHLEWAARLNADLGQTQAWWRNQIVLLQVANDAASPEALRTLARWDGRPDGLEDGALGAVLLHERARAWMTAGRLDEALKEAERAMAAYERAGDRAGKAAAGVIYAKILRRLGKFTQSATAWSRVLGEFEALGDPRGVAVSLAGWGGSLGDEGKELGKALDLLGRAEANYEALGVVTEAREVAREAQALRERSGN